VPKACCQRRNPELNATRKEVGMGRIRAKAKSARNRVGYLRPRPLVVSTVIALSLGLTTGCGDGGITNPTSTATSTGSTAIATTLPPKCRYEGTRWSNRQHPAATNDVRVSGGATCAVAAWLYFHAFESPETARGWTCAKQLLGPNGPTLIFCAHGRDKRASWLFS
jgi:hypothetical protein